MDGKIRGINVGQSPITNVKDKLSAGHPLSKIGQAQVSRDASNLSLTQSLKSDTQLATIQLKKLNEGFAVLSAADDGLRQIGKVLERMQYLAQEVFTGAYGVNQRSALQNEFTALGSEIQRVAHVTNYRGVELIDGDSIVASVKKKKEEFLVPLFSQIDGTLHSLQLSDTSGKLTFSINAGATDLAQSSARKAFDALGEAIHRLSEERGEVAAAKNRLEQSIKELHHKRHPPHHDEHKRELEITKTTSALSDALRQLPEASSAHALDAERVRKLLDLD
jgi:flagellin